MIPEVHACSGYLVITPKTGVSRQRRSPEQQPDNFVPAMRVAVLVLAEIAGAING
jgi:hypothetical protein